LRLHFSFRGRPVPSRRLQLSERMPMGALNVDVV